MMSGGDVTKLPKTNEAADDKEIAQQFEGLDNDLVNVGKFTDEAADSDGVSREEGDEEQPGLA